MKKGILPFLQEFPAAAAAAAGTSNWTVKVMDLDLVVVSVLDQPKPVETVADTVTFMTSQKEASTEALT